MLPTHTHAIAWLSLGQKVSAQRNDTPELVLLLATTQAADRVAWRVASNHFCARQIGYDHAKLRIK